MTLHDRSAERRLAALRPAQARIDLDRLAENYRAVARFAARPVLPVVKADGYGHGIAQISHVLQALGAPMLAVAYPEEGLALRTAGITVPIVVLAGFAPLQWPVLLGHALTPVISTPAALAEVVLAAAGHVRRPVVHLKVDTGMSRLGFPPAQLAEAAARLVDAGVEIDGLMTHLASADEDPAMTETQLDRFDDATNLLAARGIRPRWVHAANSAGLASLRPGHTLVRPGLLLYGLKPRPLSPDLVVHPVMSLSARIGLVKEVEIGTRVSYGGRWVASRPSRIATIPIGYADGVPRTSAMAERGEVSVRGARVRVAGSVCMDLVMADVTDRPDVGEGDEVVFLGDDPDAWDVAEWAGTNAWQVLTSVGPRVPRVYVQDGRVVEFARARSGQRRRRSGRSLSPRSR